MFRVTFPYPLEKGLSWIPTHRENFDNDQAFEFAMTDKDSGVLYGAICLFNNQKHKNGEVGYWIREDYWGRGITTEAVKGGIKIEGKQIDQIFKEASFETLILYGIVNHSDDEK